MRKLFALGLVMLLLLSSLCACGMGYETLFKAKGYTIERLEDDIAQSADEMQTFAILQKSNLLEEETIKWAIKATNEAGDFVFVIQYVTEQNAAEAFAHMTHLNARIKGSAIAIGTEDALEIFES